MNGQGITPGDWNLIDVDGFKKIAAAARKLLVCCYQQRDRTQDQKNRCNDLQKSVGTLNQWDRDPNPDELTDPRQDAVNLMNIKIARNGMQGHLNDLLSDIDKMNSDITSAINIGIIIDSIVSFATLLM